MKKYKKIILIIVMIYSFFILISNAKVINSLSVSKELIKEIEENENLNVEINGEFLGRDNFMPGDSINDDKITLVNNEEFPVKFSLNLTKEGEVLKDRLKVDLIGAKSIFNNDVYEIIVNPNESKDIYSNVVWKDEDYDIDTTNQYLKNNYSISAMKKHSIYESYFNKEQDLRDWTLELGLLDYNNDGMIISSKKTGDKETYGKMFLDKFDDTEILVTDNLEVSLIIDVSKLIESGRDKDGFDCYTILNDKNKNIALNFTFHMYFYDNKLRVYCNNQYGDTPTNDNGYILPYKNILKFKQTFSNKGGYLEVKLSIEDMNEVELYSKVLNKKGQINESKWDINNISNIRRIGFSAVKCNDEITVRYLEIMR